MIALILIEQQCSWTPKGLVGDLHLWFNIPYVAKEKEKHIHSSSLFSGSMSQSGKASVSISHSFIYLCWKITPWITKDERIHSHLPTAVVVPTVS